MAALRRSRSGSPQRLAGTATVFTVFGPPSIASCDFPAADGALDFASVFSDTSAPVATATPDAARKSRRVRSLGGVTSSFFSCFTFRFSSWLLFHAAKDRDVLSAADADADSVEFVVAPLAV